MILPIIYYGHPVLRQKGAKIKAVTPEISSLAGDMIETMRSARGVGLAAQQIGKAIQLAVVDIRDIDKSSQLLVGVKDVNIDSWMPFILINPLITRYEGEELGEEGCLSFPQINGEVPRATTIHVSAMDLNEEPIQFVATGFLSRVIQHEVDHLNGVLFIDRMNEEVRSSIVDQYSKLEKETIQSLKKKRKKR